MRTKTLILAAALTAAGLASSLAQSNVYSLNVVGYVNKTLTGGSLFTLINNPLNTTNNTLAGIFGAGGVGLPSGSQVQVWDYGTQDFIAYTKQPVGPGFSGGGATVPFPVGKGVFVKINTVGDYTNTFVGEVLQGNLTNATLANFNLIGSLVPQAGLASADLGLNPAPGAQVQRWDVGIQDFVISTKTPVVNGWSGAGQPNLAVGEGFFLKNNTPYDWVRNFTVQ